MLGIGKNKGGVALAMKLRNTPLCFINSHLAAHQDKVIPLTLTLNLTLTLPLTLTLTLTLTLILTLTLTLTVTLTQVIQRNQDVRNILRSTRLGSTMCAKP